MIKILLGICMSLLFCDNVFAHGGGLDSCGGHKDRKRGGYHVHNYSKYCACHPDADECKKEEQTKETSEILNKPIKLLKTDDNNYDNE